MSLRPEEVREMFVSSGALLEGHFQLSSGLHSPRYMQCALVLALPAMAERLGRELAALAPVKPDLVLSPAMGGLIIGHEVARALGVRAYFAEREQGALTLRRGFSLRPGEKALVVEDVVTTGKSSGEVFELLRARGAEPAGLLSIVDRSGGAAAALGAPFRSLAAFDIPSYRPEDCPLCREGKPAIKPGSRTLSRS